MGNIVKPNISFIKTGDPKKSLKLGVSIVIELQKQEANNSSDNAYRSFDPVQAGKYTISIQGGPGLYSEPRKTVPADQYETMEIAIFENDIWLSAKDKMLKAFPRYDELLERCDGVESVQSVFGYVPVDLINDLYLYLRNI